MLERLLLTFLIIAVGTGAYWLFLRRQRKQIEAALPGLEGRIAGIPLILYFTTPTCIPCKTVQRPAIDTVERLMSDRLQVITIDASEKPEIADHWGVMSVPTTYLFDGSGKLLAQNSGVVRAEKLVRQLCPEHITPEKEKAAT
jgi:thioredoxin-like negative regulator of GroEL